ncbi:hypothetical protein ABIC71_004611 [Herbaspirillum seropedicae]
MSCWSPMQWTRSAELVHRASSAVRFVPSLSPLWIKTVARPSPEPLTGFLVHTRWGSPFRIVHRRGSRVLSFPGPPRSLRPSTSCNPGRLVRSVYLSAAWWVWQTWARAQRKRAQFSFIVRLFIRLVVMVNVRVLMWITWFTPKKSVACATHKPLGKACMT